MRVKQELRFAASSSKSLHKLDSGQEKGEGREVEHKGECPEGCEELEREGKHPHYSTCLHDSPGDLLNSLASQLVSTEDTQQLQNQLTENQEYIKRA